MGYLRLFSAVVLSACLVHPGLGAEDVPAPKACRPLFSTSAAPADPGVLELEMGAQKLYNRDGSSDRLFPMQFNLGLTSWLDFRVGWGGPLLRKDAQGEIQNGGADPVLGGQILLLKQSRAGFDLGMAYWHKVPRASTRKGLGTGRHDDTLLLTFSKTVGRWAIDANAGANFVGHPDKEGRVWQNACSLAVTYAVAQGWNLTLDTYALQATELNERAVSSILALSRDIGSNLCLDAGIEVGHTRGAPRFSLNAGLVWRMGRLWGGK